MFLMASLECGKAASRPSTVINSLPRSINVVGAAMCTAPGAVVGSAVGLAGRKTLFLEASLLCLLGG